MNQSQKELVFTMKQRLYDNDRDDLSTIDKWLWKCKIARSTVGKLKI